MQIKPANIQIHMSLCSSLVFTHLDAFAFISSLSILCKHTENWTDCWIKGLQVDTK